MAPAELCHGQAVPNGQTRTLVTTVKNVDRPEEFLPGAFLRCGEVIEERYRLFCCHTF